MSIPARNIDSRKKFQWVLEITTPFGPEDIGKFVECDQPSSEIEKAEYNSAGTLHSIKQPGRRKFKDINFKKLMISAGADELIYLWFIQGCDTDSGLALPPSVIKRDVHLIHLNDLGLPIEMWVLKGAWISMLEGDKLEGGSSDFEYETGTICYDRFERGPVAV